MSLYYLFQSLQRLLKLSTTRPQYIFVMYMYGYDIKIKNTVRFSIKIFNGQSSALHGLYA